MFVQVNSEPLFFFRTSFRIIPLYFIGCLSLSRCRDISFFRSFFNWEPPPIFLALISVNVKGAGLFQGILITCPEIQFNRFADNINLVWNSCQLYFIFWIYSYWYLNSLYQSQFLLPISTPSINISFFQQLSPLQIHLVFSI